VDWEESVALPDPDLTEENHYTPYRQPDQRLEKHLLVSSGKKRQDRTDLVSPRLRSVLTPASFGR